MLYANVTDAAERIVTTSAGELRVRVVGPKDAATPPVVFVHGFLVDSTLWDGVAERLAAAGVTSYLVDWPLGSHRTPMSPDAALSPQAVADLIDEVLATLGLDDVTLVGNDTGGAICQLLVASHPARIGRLVLTNCDAFDNFPPKAFVPLFAAARHPLLTRALLAPMGLRPLRHSPMAFGMLLRKPRDAALTEGWISPARHDARIRDDIARFARGLDRRCLVDAEAALARFTRPVRIVWGAKDRNFGIGTARRLAELFPAAELIEVPGVSTFVPVDAPDAVAAAILDVQGQSSAANAAAARAAPSVATGR
ncbi:MAG: alpha/beta fold hydrolase [Ilumatobacteraceae bacterium]